MPIGSKPCSMPAQNRLRANDPAQFEQARHLLTPEKEEEAPPLNSASINSLAASR